MLKRVFIIIFCLIFSATVSTASVFESPQNLSTITKQLPELKDITCKFKQEKTFPNSTVKLNSSGNFKFIKDKGIIFHTTYPTEGITTYNNNEYKQINDIINALSSKNYKKIEAVFQFFFVKTNEKWELGLKPKQNQQCSKYLNSIEIEGKSYITKIIITTKTSGKTTIWFNK